MNLLWLLTATSPSVLKTLKVPLLPGFGSQGMTRGPNSNQMEAATLALDPGPGTIYQFYPGMGQSTTHPAFAGDDYRVLLMQITTNRDVEGQFGVRQFQMDNRSNPPR